MTNSEFKNGINQELKYEGITRNKVSKVFDDNYYHTTLTFNLPLAEKEKSYLTKRFGDRWVLVGVHTIYLKHPNEK